MLGPSSLLLSLLSEQFDSEDSVDSGGSISSLLSVVGCGGASVVGGGGGFVGGGGGGGGGFVGGGGGGIVGFFGFVQRPAQGLHSKFRQQSSLDEHCQI